MQAQRGQPRPTSAAGTPASTCSTARSGKSPETVETRDLSFPILRLLDLVLASANRFGAAPATGGKAGPQARPHAVGLDPGEDAAMLEARKPAHAARSGGALVSACW
jgi:hypothetical protein